MALFSDAVEEVRLERWAASSTIDLDLKGGGEFLVLEGSFNERGETFELQSWLRLPAGDRLNASVGPNGCKLWIKTGHLTTRLNTPVAA